MNNEPAQTEEKQHTVYFNIKRNWTPEKNDNSFYEDKVFFLKDGRIGMERGGLVIVKTIEAWMALRECRFHRNQTLSQLTLTVIK